MLRDRRRDKGRYRIQKHLHQLQVIVLIPRLNSIMTRIYWGSSLIGSFILLFLAGGHLKLRCELKFYTPQVKNLEGVVSLSITIRFSIWSQHFSISRGQDNWHSTAHVCLQQRLMPWGLHVSLSSLLSNLLMAPTKFWKDWCMGIERGEKDQQQEKRGMIIVSFSFPHKKWEVPSVIGKRRWASFVE